MRTIKHLFYTICGIVIPTISMCQHLSSNYIEVSVFNTFNTQGRYDSKYGEVSYVNSLKLSGPDLGFLIDYKRKLYDNVFVKFGLGYMDFKVDKIENSSSLGGPQLINARAINYPSYVFVLYSTTKYHYQNFLIHLAAEKDFKLLSGLYLVSSINFFHAFKISQQYYIPKGEGDTYYRTRNRGDFGDFFDLHIGVSKEIGRFSLSPALVIPIYKSWHQDVIFLENPDRSVNNWFSGVGISVSLSYH